MRFDSVRAAKLLRLHEGERRFPYKDTVGKLTIGVGFNLDDEGLYPDEIEYILLSRIKRYASELDLAFPLAAAQTSVRKVVLIDMIFNLGVKRLRGFRKMWAALEAEDYETAAAEMLDSKWARQVGPRAKRLAYMMREDAWPDRL